MRGELVGCCVPLDITGHFVRNVALYIQKFTAGEGGKLFYFSFVVFLLPSIFNCRGPTMQPAKRRPRIFMVAFLVTEPPGQTTPNSPTAGGGVGEHGDKCPITARKGPIWYWEALICRCEGRGTPRKRKELGKGAYTDEINCWRVTTKKGHQKIG